MYILSFNLAALNYPLEQSTSIWYLWVNRMLKCNAGLIELELELVLVAEPGPIPQLDSALSVSPSQEQNHCNILNKLSDIYAHCQKFHLLAITQTVHIESFCIPHHHCCIFQPALRCCALQQLVKICFCKIWMINKEKWGKNVLILKYNT